MKRKATGFLLVGMLLLAPAGVGIFHVATQHAQEAARTRLRLERRRAAWGELKKELWAEIRRFRGETGVVVEDLETGWTLGYRHEQTFPAASIIKIPIMAACFQAAEEGKIRLTDPVVLKASDRVAGSGVLKGRPPGTTLTVEQLIELMVTESDNTAANLLMGLVGVDDLNRFFEREGLKNTSLSRRMMDFSNRKQGVENYTTAEDMALLLKRLYGFQVVSPAVSKKCLELLMRTTLNDRIPAQLPPQIVVAHKTGLERGVCHDSGIVFTESGNYLICVLTKTKGPSRPAKKFIARLSALAYQYLTGS